MPPSTVGLPAGWGGQGGTGPRPCTASPGRLCLPCAATGDPRVLPWQQNHGLCFQKTSQSPVCEAGLGVWSTWQSPRRGKRGKEGFAGAPPPPAHPIFLNSRDLIVLDACRKLWRLGSSERCWKEISLTGRRFSAIVAFCLVWMDLFLRGNPQRKEVYQRAEKAMDGCVCRSVSPGLHAGPQSLG